MAPPVIAPEPPPLPRRRRPRWMRRVRFQRIPAAGSQACTGTRAPFRRSPPRSDPPLSHPPDGRPHSRLLGLSAEAMARLVGVQLETMTAQARAAARARVAEAARLPRADETRTMQACFADGTAGHHPVALLLDRPVDDALARLFGSASGMKLHPHRVTTSALRRAPGDRRGHGGGVPRFPVRAGPERGA